MKQVPHIFTDDTEESRDLAYRCHFYFELDPEYRRVKRKKKEEQILDRISENTLDPRIIFGVALLLNIILHGGITLIGGAAAMSILMLIPITVIGGIGMVYKLNKWYYMNRKFKGHVDLFQFWLNENVMPHKCIDKFLLWEEGDKLLVSNDRRFKYTDEYIYKGVSNDQRVVLENENGDLIPFPPRYLSTRSIENESLKKRKKNQLSNELKNEVDTSEYTGLMKKCLSDFEQQMESIKYDRSVKI